MFSPREGLFKVQHQITTEANERLHGVVTRCLSQKLCFACSIAFTVGLCENLC